MKSKPIDLRAAKRQRVPRLNADPSGPIWSEAAEGAALGCVLWAGDETRGSQSEVDSLLGQLSPRLFYDGRNKEIFDAMIRLRTDSHVVNLITLSQSLRDSKKLEVIGGLPRLNEFLDLVPSFINFPEYLRILKDKALRRWILGKRDKLLDLAGNEELSIETIRSEFADLHDRSASIGSAAPLIDLISPIEARAFEPDPSDYLIGEGLITSDTINTIGGEPGVGKSRLAVTLCVAGAKGSGTWQGYPVRTKFRSLILQSENTGARLKDEFSAIPKYCDDSIKISRGLSRGIAFGDADFRRELLRIYDAWPFRLLVVDPWNDVSFEEGQSDYKQALLNIRRTFSGRKCPAVMIVAHLRKQRADGNRWRKSGRELLHELSGSLALGSTSRSVFVVQAASSGLDDDRIVFEVAKSNDARPEWLSKFGTRSAWHRKNGEFTPCESFDWQAYDNPGDEERRGISSEILEDCFAGITVLKPSALARRISERAECGISTAFRAIGKGGYLRKHLEEDSEGLLSLA